MRKSAVIGANSCHHAENAAAQYKTEQHPAQVPVSTRTTGGCLSLGKTSLKKVDGKTSISWAGETNKSFMKRIGSIRARAKRMLICFAT